MKNQKVIFITGASRGIGAAIAKSFIGMDCCVAIGYYSNRALAEQVAFEVNAANAKAECFQIDISNQESILQAFEDVNAKWGPVDILVNNAAIAQEKPFLSISENDWDAMLSTNLKGPFLASQTVLPNMMAKKWGRIINIVSIGGQWGGINQIHYASAKSGLIGLTKSLAKTFGSYGITVNAVSPGLVQSDMSSNELTTEAGKEKLKGIPAGRIGTPQEIAAAVLFLASNESQYINGQTINVNGGMYFG
jgi:NAD(P)-dependent dehydrogenase (short-subunit alcohol dehydrogenase family)